MDRVPTVNHCAYTLLQCALTEYHYSVDPIPKGDSVLVVDRVPTVNHYAYTLLQCAPYRVPLQCRPSILRVLCTGGGQSTYC